MPRNSYTTKCLAPTGYVAVTKPLAKRLYESGVCITFTGDRVNSCHVFDGYHSGCTIHKSDTSEYDTFESVVKAYTHYAMNGLGTHPVFYVEKCAYHEHIQGTLQD